MMMIFPERWMKQANLFGGSSGRVQNSTRMIMRKIKLTTVVLAVMALAALNSCGNTEDFTATHTVGPAGPTAPSGYYFDLTVSPYVVTDGGTFILTSRVTDGAGNAVAGAIVILAGDAEESCAATTDAAGYGSCALTVDAGGAFVGYITAQLENKALTVPYQVVP